MPGMREQRTSSNRQPAVLHRTAEKWSAQVAGTGFRMKDA